MVGFSALMQKSESLTLELLEEPKQILRAIFPKFNGIEISTIGDAFLVEFESAVKAVQGAIEIQKALRRRNQDTPEREPLRVRIGIHLGDVVHAGDNILGDGVNIAARIYPLAPPEGICISEDVMRQVQNKLEYPLRKLDKTQLKNISLSVETFLVELPWLPKTAFPKKKDALRKAVPAAEKKSKVRWLVSVAAVIALAVALYIVLPARRSTAADANSKTVAVLPFTKMSGNPEEEFFSDGITEDILTRLCQISDLNIILRTTMSRYKNSKKTTRAIGRELHAGVVLEGSVRRADNLLRITGRLIDARNDRPMWAKTYDNEVKDVFEIQSKIAREIVAALQVRLSPGEKEHLDKPKTSNTQAYNLYLQGRFFMNRRDRENIAKAVELFNKALAVDPNDARVWAGLADATMKQADQGFVANMEAGYKDARKAGGKSPRSRR